MSLGGAARRNSLPASLFQREVNSFAPFEEGGWGNWLLPQGGSTARRNSLPASLFQREGNAVT